MTRFSLIAASIGTFAIATVAHAHPGHGEPGDDYSLIHYATEPLHIAVGVCLMVGAAAGIGLIRVAYLRRGKQAPAR